MILGEVLGRVWAERQHSGLDGRRLVLVRDLASDARHVAVDLLDAGTGTTVLVATDEAAAAVTDLPWVDAAVIALVGRLGRSPHDDGESPFPARRVSFLDARRDGVFAASKTQTRRHGKGDSPWGGGAA